MSLPGTYIKRAVLDITMDEELHNKGFEDILSKAMVSGLSDFIDEEVKKAAPGEGRFSIDTLSIDLGTLSDSNSREEFIAKFREAFPQALRSALPAQAADGRLDLVREFLETGIYPWWAPQDGTKDPDQLLNELLPGPGTKAPAWLRELIAKPTVRERMSGQLREVTLVRVVDLLLGEASVQATVNAVLQSLQRAGYSWRNNDPKARMKWLLLQIAAAKSAAPNLQQLLAALLPELSRELQVSLPQLVTAITRQPRLDEKSVVTKELLTALPGTNLSAADETSVASAESKHPGRAPALLSHFITYASLPPAFFSGDENEFIRLLARFAEKNRDRLLLFLRPALHDPKLLLRMYEQLTAGAAAELLEIFFPQRSAASVAAARLLLQQLRETEAFYQSVFTPAAMEYAVATVQLSQTFHLASPDRLPRLLRPFVQFDRRETKSVASAPSFGALPPLVQNLLLEKARDKKTTLAEQQQSAAAEKKKDAQEKTGETSAPEQNEAAFLNERFLTDLLLFYVRELELPWWGRSLQEKNYLLTGATSSKPKSEAQLFSAALSYFSIHFPTAFKKLAAELIATPETLHQLLWQLPVQELLKIVSAAFPHDEARYLAAAQQLLKAAAAKKSALLSPESAIRDFTALFLEEAARKKTGSGEAAFRAFVLLLAVKAGMSSEELLQALPANVLKAKRSATDATNEVRAENEISATTTEEATAGTLPNTFEFTDETIAAFKASYEANAAATAAPVIRFFSSDLVAFAEEMLAGKITGPVPVHPQELEEAILTAAKKDEAFLQRIKTVIGSGSVTEQWLVTSFSERFAEQLFALITADKQLLKLAERTIALLDRQQVLTAAGITRRQLLFLVMRAASHEQSRKSTATFAAILLQQIERTFGLATGTLQPRLLLSLPEELFRGEKTAPVPADELTEDIPQPLIPANEFPVVPNELQEEAAQTIVPDDELPAVAANEMQEVLQTITSDDELPVIPVNEIQEISQTITSDDELPVIPVNEIQEVSQTIAPGDELVTVPANELKQLTAQEISIDAISPIEAALMELSEFAATEKSAAPIAGDATQQTEQSLTAADQQETIQPGSGEKDKTRIASNEAEQDSLIPGEQKTGIVYQPAAIALHWRKAAEKKLKLFFTTFSGPQGAQQEPFLTLQAFVTKEQVRLEQALAAYVSLSETLVQEMQALAWEKLATEVRETLLQLIRRRDEKQAAIESRQPVSATETAMEKTAASEKEKIKEEPIALPDPREKLFLDPVFFINTLLYFIRHLQLPWWSPYKSMESFSRYATRVIPNNRALVIHHLGQALASEELKNRIAVQLGETIHQETPVWEQQLHTRFFIRLLRLLLEQEETSAELRALLASGEQLLFLAEEHLDEQAADALLAGLLTELEEKNQFPALEQLLSAETENAVWAELVQRAGEALIPGNVLEKKAGETISPDPVPVKDETAPDLIVADPLTEMQGTETTVSPVSETELTGAEKSTSEEYDDSIEPVTSEEQQKPVTGEFTDSISTPEQTQQPHSLTDQTKPIDQNDQPEIPGTSNELTTAFDNDFTGVEQSKTEESISSSLSETTLTEKTETLRTTVSDELTKTDQPETLAPSLQNELTGTEQQPPPDTTDPFAATTNELTGTKQPGDTEKLASSKLSPTLLPDEKSQQTGTDSDTIISSTEKPVEDQLQEQTTAQISSESISPGNDLSAEQKTKDNADQSEPAKQTIHETGETISPRPADAQLQKILTGYNDRGAFSEKLRQLRKQITPEEKTPAGKRKAQRELTGFVQPLTQLLDAPRAAALETQLPQLAQLVSESAAEETQPAELLRATIAFAAFAEEKSPRQLLNRVLRHADAPASALFQSLTDARQQAGTIPTPTLYLIAAELLGFSESIAPGAVPPARLAYWQRLLARLLPSVAVAAPPLIALFTQELATATGKTSAATLALLTEKLEAIRRSDETFHPAIAPFFEAAKQKLETFSDTAPNPYSGIFTGLQQQKAALHDSGKPLHEVLASRLAKTIATDPKFLDAMKAAAEPEARKKKESGKKEEEAWAEQKQPESKAEPIYVFNSGLVLFWPFISGLFRRLGYLEGKQFAGPEKQVRAVHLLQYMADESEQPPEHLLPLNKLMCGLHPSSPLERWITLTDDEKKEAGLFSASVKAKWEVLKKTSMENFRKGFIQREGLLYSKDPNWELQVQRISMDVLLSKLPWGFSTVKFPWNEGILFVKWKI